MKASELRIGNYVNVPFQEQCPFRIDAFEYCSEKFIKVAQEVKLNGFEVHPLTWYGRDLKPIPLTEEWLFKFGFYLRDGFSNTFKLNVEKHKYDCSEITYSEKEGLFRFSNGQQKGTTLIPHIKYVHQLQNLYFALTGEELKQK
jgi:hypothetical protein